MPPRPKLSSENVKVGISIRQIFSKRKKDFGQYQGNRIIVTYRDAQTGKIVKGGFAKTVSDATLDNIEFNRREGRLSDKEYARTIYNQGRVDERIYGTMDSFKNILIDRWDLGKVVDDKLFETFKDDYGQEVGQIKNPNAPINVSDFSRWYEKYGFQLKEVFSYKDRLSNGRTYTRAKDHYSLAKILRGLREFSHDKAKFDEIWGEWLNGKPDLEQTTL